MLVVLLVYHIIYLITMSDLLLINWLVSLAMGHSLIDIDVRQLTPCPRAPHRYLIPMTILDIHIELVLLSLSSLSFCSSWWRVDTMDRFSLNGAMSYCTSSIRLLHGGNVGEERSWVMTVSLWTHVTHSILLM